jgi:tRNA1Val (adenine37-N6)-methyltransferase
MSNQYFQFKQFTVWHDKCAMKVGTDGVLLGAWINPGNATRILDIGAGTGVIALMLAQKTNAIIDAIDIDKDAVQQAQDNIKRTPWKNRISVIETSFQEFAKTSNYKYDLIVTNPPYFENSLKSNNIPRNIARHNDSLPFEELLQGVSRLLDNNGKFSVILPYVDAQIFIVDAALCHLYCNVKTMVKPSDKKKVSRILLEFSSERKKIIETSISILNSENEYSKEYKNLTKDFYLNF